mmetsp:Transcript_34289/g.106460  ORF Transcript_34289/g.106460 Transcript_34289/m.106460 type:complete len:231 (-) Transcript_34289:86-778(-)
MRAPLLLALLPCLAALAGASRPEREVADALQEPTAPSTAAKEAPALQCEIVGWAYKPARRFQSIAEFLNSAQECLKKCLQTEVCKYYTWIAHRRGGECWLSQARAKMYKSKKAVSGPKSCQHCFKAYRRREPLDMPGTAPQLEGDPVSCQYRCHKTPGCAFFVYYPNKACHLQDISSTEQDDRYGATTGPSTCHDARESENVTIGAYDDNGPMIIGQVTPVNSNLQISGV